MFGLTPYTRNFYVASYDPFKEMEELERRFFGQRTPALKTDIREVETGYILDCDLPGFAREDVSIEIKNGYMTIRAERKNDTESRDSYLRRERTYGSFSRTFDLEGIDAEVRISEPAGQTDSPIFDGVTFCTPDPLENYPCFDTYHETALTY